MAKTTTTRKSLTEAADKELKSAFSLDKFKANNENKEKYNKIRKVYIAEKRIVEPVKFQERNIRDVAAFRAREKLQKQSIQQKFNASDYRVCLVFWNCNNLFT